MSDPAQGGVWPPPTFYFSVQLGEGGSASFQEVSGLDGSPPPIEYRPAGTPAYAPVQMPALGGVGNVTLHRGVFANGPGFWSWCNGIRMGTAPRGTVVITLLDDAGAVKMTWTLNNAWPTKITGLDPNSAGAEVAVDALELAYETLVTATP